MPNAVIYARYSSHAQRDTSIDQQLAVCRSFAQRGGIDVDGFNSGLIIDVLPGQPYFYCFYYNGKMKLASGKIMCY